MIIKFLAMAIPIFLSGCVSFSQTSTEVAIREPGQHKLGVPIPNGPEATADWQFAWLSQAAYERTKGGTVSDTTCGVSDVILTKQGWIRWEGFPDDGLQKRIDKYNLRVEVWEQRSSNSIVISFGGTVFNSNQDWFANLRWFLPSRNDEYTAVVTDFGPAFIEEYARRAGATSGEYLKSATLYSTGHSLGGGLAQEFAYSLPINSAGLRVHKVFAFDPSPVTGFCSIDLATRDSNRKGLLIDRIYERGEILAIVRSFTNFLYPPSDIDPQIRTVRYDLFSGNPIGEHSMGELACKLQLASGN